MNARKILGEVVVASRNSAEMRPHRELARQAGMTTVGILLMVCFVGLFAFAGIRLTPVYLNYMKVAGVLSGVEEEFDGQNPSRDSIKKSISRRFDVESVSEITARDVTVTAEGNGFVVKVSYDHMTPFISNIYFTVRFEKSVQVRR
ncbi:MAG: DUF4845 domain-containing protein [Gammaproteobacteria bacterium]|nr:DUF4845 domain-containing protein [Gammaproteobacteria bacterium]MDH4313525.1 DUF4845 domain-containing protein [Gammaproteobacteria bacterium]MDH5212594.1 DUF4845 domain-containing protein [Gammaproteobacteria bacterium]MDH5500540.1 DUF4845 domain-containing protein [Gammaproteobacteria bacterium]